MSINNDFYFNLKNKLEEAKDDLKYSSDDMVRYYSGELEKVAEEILKSLAAEWLSNDLYYEEYPDEDGDELILTYC